MKLVLFKLLSNILDTVVIQQITQLSVRPPWQLSLSPTVSETVKYHKFSYATCFWHSHWSDPTGISPLAFASKDYTHMQLTHIANGLHKIKYWHQTANAPSTRSLFIDKKTDEVRPLVRASVLCSIQCLDSDGCMTGRIYGPQKTQSTNPKDQMSVGGGNGRARSTRNNT